MAPLNLVLSLYPSTKGCGYVLFEGALSPFDWGVTQFQGPARNRRLLAVLKRLIVRYQPAVITLEDWHDGTYRRSKQIVALYDRLLSLADGLQVPVATIPMRSVRNYFAQRNATTKHQIALHIAKIVPAFSYQLPPIRRAWHSGNRRQALYDAASIGLAYLSAFTASSRPSL